jgi:hypothetical protein
MIYYFYIPINSYYLLIPKIPHILFQIDDIIDHVFHQGLAYTATIACSNLSNDDQDASEYLTILSNSIINTSNQLK